MTGRRVLVTDAKVPETWWAVWRTKDYSWAGLISKRWYGWQVNSSGLCLPAPPTSAARQANLQDYWRRGPGSGREKDLRSDEEIDRDLLASGELVLGPAGELWHVMHLPLRWRDGTISIKFDWDETQWEAISKLLVNRTISDQALYELFDEFDDNADRRAAFSGIIIDKIQRSSKEAFNIKADYAAILEELDLSQGKVGSNLNLDNSFINLAKFSGATFCETNEEHYASFNGALFVDDSKFREVRFETLVEFIDTEFTGYPDFSLSVFAEVCRFDGAKFADGAWFWRTVFQKPAWFTNSTWGSGGSFGVARFMGTPAFEGAQLHQDITFDAAEFSAVDLALREAHVRLFTAVVVAILCGSLSVTILRHVDLRHGLINVLPVAAGTLLAFGCAAYSAAALSWLIRGGPLRARSSQDESVDEGDGNLERWARAYRTLALLTDNVGNKRDAAKFHRLELRASRLRPGTSLREMLVSKPVERSISALFDITSGYGESIIRPILFLIVAILVFAKVFMYIGGAPAGDQASVISAEAVSYSASRAFPFGNWSEAENGNECSLRKRLFVIRTDDGIVCRPAGQAAEVLDLESRRLSIAAIGTLESATSAVLIFLFGLGVRRKFRIG